MAFCTSCGNELDDAPFCINCGAKNETSSHEYRKVNPETVQEQAVSPNLLIASSGIMNNPSAGTDKKKYFVVGGLAVGLILVLFVIASVTAKHWVKVDVPAHAETFHSETYLTGAYNIVDDGVTPCYLRQSWIGCANSYVNEYNSTCAVYPLTPSASTYCSSYRAMIDDMQSQSWSYVASLGTTGRLTAIPEEATEQVSNNDYRPAVTHEAVCYLGFIGECEE